MEGASYQSKYYQNNKSKVLEYKKEFYLKKVEKFRNVKNVFINGISKSLNLRIIKKAITQNRLFITLDDGESFTNDLNDIDFIIPVICLAAFELPDKFVYCNELTYEQCFQLSNCGNYNLHIFINNVKQK
jgi:hypothetical protein